MPLSSNRLCSPTTLSRVFFYIQQCHFIVQNIGGGLLDAIYFILCVQKELLLPASPISPISIRSSGTPMARQCPGEQHDCTVFLSFLRVNYVYLTAPSQQVEFSRLMGKNRSCILTCYTTVTTIRSFRRGQTFN